MSQSPNIWRALESICILLPFRVALGGIFIFAAWVKLENPQAFTDSIKGFKLVDAEKAEHLITLTTFALPWAEAICGLLLILGLMTRSAAAFISVQLVIFTGAIASVMIRDMNVECGCFGDYNWPCPKTDAEGKTLGMGWCHIWRDVAMLIPAIYLTFRGGGYLALDRAMNRRGEPAPDPETTN